MKATKKKRSDDREKDDSPELRLDSRNANTHNEASYAAIRSSLQQLGAGRSIVVDRNGIAIGGNATLKQAMELGIPLDIVRTQGERLVVVMREDLDTSDPRRKALAIADNRTAELSEWDVSVLKGLWDELPQDMQAVTGFDMQSITELDVGGSDDPAVVEDEAPEPPAEPITKPGDLWLLGGHRLLCGDSTDLTAVSRLVRNERAGLMNTDPPYGVSYANDDRPNPGVAKPRVAKPRVANDDVADEELQAFLERCFFAAASLALIDYAAWYLWHAHLTQGYFAAAAAAAAANVVLHRQIIWVKPVLLLGRGQYHWKHEPCFMGWVKGNHPPDYGEGNGERTQTTVWEIGSVTHAERKEFNHSTPKPVQLFAIPIIKHLKRGEICYEPFAGSGPQFIAAEQLGRRCFGCELEPRYCDVIVKRWENLTGQKATLA